MQELIKTTVDDQGKIAVSGRELYKFLEVTERYTICGMKLEK